MNELNAILVADDLLEFLQNNSGYLACVHSVFKHALNLLIREDELITITTQSDITPMGLMVSSSGNFPGSIKAGDRVRLDPDRFTVLNQEFTINLQAAETWQTSSNLNLEALPSGDIARIRLDLIRWLAQQPAEGLLPLLPCLARYSLGSRASGGNLYSRTIADTLDAFTNMLNASDFEPALLLADRLIGFGMGSTPSCDDFLAAYLALFNITDEVSGDRFAGTREFNRRIVSKAKNRTTLISANMLRHAAEGKLSRSHQTLIQTCLFNQKGTLEFLANQVMKSGATSGGDFLLGLICALEWYQNALTKTEKEGERAWVEPNQPQPVQGI